MKRNEQRQSKSTNYNPQMWPFEPAEKSLCFLRGPLEWMTEAKNVNVRFIFVLRSHVFVKRGNGTEEIAGRWQNNSFCQQIINLCLLGVICKASDWKTLSSEKFSVLETFCYQYLKGGCVTILRMCELWQELIVFKPIGSELEACKVIGNLQNSN